MLSQVVRRVPLEVFPLGLMIFGACGFAAFQLTKNVIRNPDIVVDKTKAFAMLDSSTAYQKNRWLVWGTAPQ